MTDDKLRAALIRLYDLVEPNSWEIHDPRCASTGAEVACDCGLDNALDQARAALAASATDDGRWQSRIEAAIADISEEWAESAEWLSRMIVGNMRDTDPQNAVLQVDNQRPAVPALDVRCSAIWNGCRCDRKPHDGDGHVWRNTLDGQLVDPARYPRPAVPALDAMTLGRAMDFVDREDEALGVVGRGRKVDRIIEAYAALSPKEPTDAP